MPRRWREEWGVRRYGFHGIAVQWVASQLPVERLVVCHLGGGCSVTAVRERSIGGHDDGLQPARGGPDGDALRVDRPGVLPYLVREHGLSLEEVERALEHESGLAALGGLDDELGFGVYTYRIAAAVARWRWRSEDWTSSRSRGVSARTGTTSEPRSPSGSPSWVSSASRWFRRKPSGRGQVVIADEVRACLERADRRELNRALLARQMLLERVSAPLPRVLERMGGLQAQYAPSMYIGLWSRVEGLEREAVTRALERRSIVQGSMMRATIHLVSKRDYWPFIVGIRRGQQKWWLRDAQA